MPDSPHQIVLSLAEFDRSKLPEVQRNLSGDEFRLAVRDHLQEEFSDESGAAQVITTGDRIIIRWDSDSAPKSLTDQGIERLQQGNYQEGVLLLEKAVKSEPEDELALLNLGMALSDLNRFPESITHLQELLELYPENQQGWVALGVARGRSKDLPGAIDALERAVDLSPEDGYAHMNLGSLLAQAGDDLEKAANHLETAARLMPQNQQAWLNLGKVCEQADNRAKAYAAYTMAMTLDASTEIGGAAERGLSRLTEAGFRQAGGELRPDAVRFCLNALETFHGMPKEQIQQITFEIATLGANGLSINNPAPQYSLRNLAGAFSGLQLLCIEYVGFRVLNVPADLGFDLAKEFSAAKRQFDASTG